MNRKQPEDKNVAFIQEMLRNDEKSVLLITRFWTNLNPFEIRENMKTIFSQIDEAYDYYSHIATCDGEENCKTMFHEIEQLVPYKFNTREFWGYYWENVLEIGKKMMLKKEELEKNEHNNN